MNDIDGPDMARRSKAYRLEHGLTQRGLAKLVKTSPGVIGELECGHVRSARVAREILALSTVEV